MVPVVFLPDSWYIGGELGGNSDIEVSHKSKLADPFNMGDTIIKNTLPLPFHTVESRYLELGYFEFCETRSIYLNQKYIFIAFSNQNLALETFFTSSNYPKCKLFCTSGNLNWQNKIPTNFEISRFDCICISKLFSIYWDICHWLSLEINSSYKRV